MLDSMASMLSTYSIGNFARYLFKSVSKHTKVDFTTSDFLVNDFEKKVWSKRPFSVLSQTFLQTQYNYRRERAKSINPVPAQRRFFLSSSLPNLMTSPESVKASTAKPKL